MISVIISNPIFMTLEAKWTVQYFTTILQNAK